MMSKLSAESQDHQARVFETLSQRTARLSTLIAVACVLIAAPTNAHAQQLVQWLGGSSGLWDVPTNWSPQVIPDQTNNVLINANIFSVDPEILILSDFIAIRSLTVGEGPTVLLRPSPTALFTNNVDFRVNQDFLVDNDANLTFSSDQTVTMLRTINVILASGGTVSGASMLTLDGRSRLSALGDLFVNDGEVRIGFFASASFFGNNINLESRSTMVSRGPVTAVNNTRVDSDSFLRVRNNTWETTSIQISDGAEVEVSGSGTLEADSMSLSSFGRLSNSGTTTVTGLTSIDLSSTFNLIGGTFQTGSLSVDSRSNLNLRGGTFHVTGPGGLDTSDSGPLNLAPAISSQLAMVVDNTLTVSPDAPINLLGGSLSAGAIQLNGGQINGSPGNSLNLTNITTGLLSGNGSVNTAVTGDAASTITANGTLVLGSLADAAGYDVAGTLNVGANHVLILDADRAQLGTTTTMDGGRLSSLNGLALGSGESLTTTTNATATIDGEFINNGTVNGPTEDGFSLVFDAAVNGTGSYTGNITFLDIFSPGTSPAAVQLENITLGTVSDLHVELGGLAPGNEHDQLVIAGDANIAGQLSIALLDGFTPADQNTFMILDVAGDLTGRFQGLDEGALVGAFAGQDLFITYTAGDGNDIALLSVPEPSTLLLLAPITAVCLRHRLRK